MPEPLTPQPHATQPPNSHRLVDTIELALATPPAVDIPADFATRIAALASTQQTPPPVVALRSPRYAQSAILLCTVAVLVALLTLIPGILARNPSQALTFTWLLSAEAVLLAAALGPWRTLWTSSSD